MWLSAIRDDDADGIRITPLPAWPEKAMKAPSEPTEAVPRAEWRADRHRDTPESGGLDAETANAPPRRIVPRIAATSRPTHAGDDQIGACRSSAARVRAPGSGSGSRTRRPNVL